MSSQAPRTLSHYIDNQLVAPAPASRTSSVHNPATGELICQVPLASADETRAAVQRAKIAFASWSQVPVGKRAQLMFEFREKILQNMDRLAETLSMEHGKMLDDAKGEIQRGLEVVEFACGIPQLLKGEYSQSVARDVDTWSFRQPMGVVAGITPFNFPAMIPLWMFPLAIACGNTFVLKPSERDPSTGLLLAQLFAEAGAPEGVLNVVHGDKEAVDALLSDADVQAVSFVGSTPVGEYIYRTGTDYGKRVQALCGAKNHMVVMPDADLDQVVDAVIGAAYGSAGERCMAISVVIAIGDEVADQLINALKPRVANLLVGPYTQQDAQMGPVISVQARERILGYIDSGVAQGAELVLDGRGVEVAGHEAGYFLGGSIFDRVTADMEIYQQEIFGPVLSIVRCQSLDEALQLVDEHEYGNGTALFTRDGDAARSYLHRVKVGMVGINVPIPVPMAYHSFGGWKRSLFGDHHIHGPEGVRFYTRLKSVTTRWPSAIRAGSVFNFKRSSEQ